MLRLMTYNVHRGGDDRQALATVIRRCAPDVVMLQEAPSGWCTRRRRLELASQVGLQDVADARRSAALVADPRRWEFRTRVIRRPHLRRRHRFYTLQLANGAVAVRTELAGRTLTVIGCHLGLHNRGRLGELDQVLALAPAGEPVVVVGDINERAGGPVWRLAEQSGLIDRCPDTATFPAHAPEHRIDAVWTSPDVSVDQVDLAGLGLSQQVLSRASDHLPVVVDLAVGRGGGPVTG